MAEPVEVELYRCPRCGRVVLEPGLLCGGTLIGKIVAEHEPTEMQGIRIEWTDEGTAMAWEGPLLAAPEGS